MRVSKFKKFLWSCAATAAASAIVSQAEPLITNVVETGGDNEATDTVVAAWTGRTFSNGVAAEFGNPYTVGFFIEDAPAYVDREAQWNGATPEMPIPDYLLGGEYIMIGNDNRDNATLKLDVTVNDEVIVYMLIDNRLSDGSGANPPHDPLPLDQWTLMPWMAIEGFTPVINGLNRTFSFTWPDEIGSDEGTAAGANLGVGPGQNINQYYSVYSATRPAGTFSLYQPDNGGRGMYGVVIKRKPGSLASPPQIQNLSPTNNTVFANASAGINFTATTVAPNSISPTGVKLFLNGTEATGLTVGGTTTARTVSYSGLAANNYYRAQIVATDQAGRSTTNNFSFDTFASTAIPIEAEDYNFGGGQVKPSLTPNAYVDAVGTPGIDYFDQNGSTAATAYRLQDYVGLAVAADVPRQAFTDAGATDFTVNSLEAGEWLNYTRTIPAGNYRIFLRGNAAAATRVELAKVTGATTTNQTATAIGVFDFQAGPNGYAPLSDVGGRPVVVALSGETTLRLTALSAFYNLNLNFIMLVPTTDAISPAYIASGTPVGGNQSPKVAVRASAVNGSTAAASVALLFDNADVSAQATVTPSASGFSGVYDPPGDLAAGSAHTVSLILQDSAGARTTNNWAFTVGTGTTLPTNIETPSGGGVGSGFLVKMRKLRNDATGIVNNLARAESQIANTLIDPATLEPYFNDAGGPNSDGKSTNIVLNFQQGTTATDTAVPSGYFGGDELFPYVTPSAFGDPNFMALEATAYLELSAGMHRFGVRSDDGFRVSFGPDFGMANATVVSSLDAGRGDGLPGGSTEFNVIVQEAGLYPVRLVWFEGTGGAALEFYSVDPITNRRTLINDPNSASSIKAFYGSSTQIFTPTITLTSPNQAVYETFPTNIALTVNAAVQNGTIAKVEYFNGANKIAEATTAPFSAVLAATEPGRYSISARATDANGFFALSGTTNIVVGKLIGINFQATTAITPEGYMADLGYVFADQGAGYSYGWDMDNTANARDRNSANSTNELYDTFNHLQKTTPGPIWEIELPNGRYQVSGVAGDADNFDSVFDLLLEGQKFILGPASADARFVSGKVNVTVADGRLTLSNGPTGANNKINFLDIYALPATAEPANLAISRVAGGIKIDWTGGGMLQSKADLNTATWTDINNSGSYTESSGSGNKFFRVVQ